MFMLDSHLTGDQSKVLTAVRDAAAEASLNLFLTGGAMRDMMGGFAIRDLDFTVEGQPIKLAKTLSDITGAELLSVDENRKSVEMLFFGNVPASISMARTEKSGRTGAKLQVQAATIHEDLSGRDFTVNSIGLSLSKASRGLLLDPANGLGDLHNKELRAVSNYALYDDPSRLLRLFRLRTRLGFAVAERTMLQYQNVREAGLETKISPAALALELRQTARDPLAGDILKAFETEGLLILFSPVLAGPKLNLQGFQKLVKARQLLPSGIEFANDSFGLFLTILFEKLNPRERSQLGQTASIEKGEVDMAAKIELRAKKLEKQIAALRVNRPSTLYNVLSKQPGEDLLYLLMHSNQRLVLDRLKNYLQKYLPTAHEVTEQEVLDRGVAAGTPKFAKLRQEMINARLDARPKKIVVVEPPPPPPLPATGPGRRNVGSFGR